MVSQKKSITASTKPFLSVIVPCYGQGEAIISDLKRIDDTLFQTRFSYEMIVVVDGRKNPSDNTFQIAKKLETENLHVFYHEKNQGKGYAVRYGMARSNGSIIAFLDAGMEISPNSLSLAVEHLLWYEADIIVGSKRHQASYVIYPLQRRILSIGYQILVWLLFGLRIRDTQVGMKIFKREVLQDVLPRLLVKRYAFDIEILAVAHALGYNKIYESPVNFTKPFDSFTSAANFRTIFGMFVDTLAVYYRLILTKYYSRKNYYKWKSDEELLINSEKLKINLSSLSKDLRKYLIEK